MKIYYQHPNTWFGDCMPFGKDDTFYLFHQRDTRVPCPFGEPFGWDLATTKDFVTYEDCGVAIPRGTDEEQDQFIFAGSICEDREGKYHAFYTGYNRDYPKQGKPSQVLMHAVSEDLKHWTKTQDAVTFVPQPGYDPDDWRDPFVLWDDGKIKFAGKYSEPDYEMLVDEDCDLAIESTMILHTPKVQEMIESLDIPVMIDRSSYESHPLGRTEWIKLYAAMLNKEDAADAFFEKQVENVDALKDFKNTEKTVAFFYVSSDGTVVVRRSDDYIPKMIELSGGRYVFDDLTGDDSNTSAVKLTMEEFYAQVADADYLIYNSSIDNPINSVKDLEEKDALFSDFKAVKEGNVWCTGKYLYQATDIVGELITDMNLMLTGGDESKMTFLYHVK